jgi:hypothetical protein
MELMLCTVHILGAVEAAVAGYSLFNDAFSATINI